MTFPAGSRGVATRGAAWRQISTSGGLSRQIGSRNVAAQKSDQSTKPHRTRSVPQGGGGRRRTRVRAAPRQRSGGTDITRKASAEMCRQPMSEPHRLFTSNALHGQYGNRPGFVRLLTDYARASDYDED